MDKIKRFFECLVPITACNLKCEYCYIIQENRREMKLAEFKYSCETMKKSLTKDRLGGTCYFSICGAGETLLQNQIHEIVYALLDNGHYVNITTNGSLNDKFRKFGEFPTAYLKRLHFSFSLHYIELKEKNGLDAFFENLDYIKLLGCSFVVQINLYDGYLPYLNEIKAICKLRCGAYPQVALTRLEPKHSIYTEDIHIHTKLNVNEYYQIGNEFDSPLFEFTYKNFMKKRKEFCYAGDWSGVLNLSTGELKQCYSGQTVQNIFEHPHKKIVFKAIGCNCKSTYCINSSHFLSLGTIPSLITPSYSDLRIRNNARWYTDEMIQFLNQKLYKNNTKYSKYKKLYIHLEYKVRLYIKGLKKIVKYILKKIYKGR